MSNYFRGLAIVAIIAAISATHHPAYGTVKKRGGTASNSRAKPKPKPSEVLVGHLMLNSVFEGETIADVCRRSDFKLLAVALEMNSGLLTSTKGEFETTEQFQARSGKLSEALNQKPIVVCEPVYDNPDIDFTYNADSSSFSGGFQNHHNVWRDVKKLGSYRSKTRMGVSATVKASVEFEYDVSLELPEKQIGCLATSYSGSKFVAPVPRDAAPAIKGRGILVILGRLAPPYIGSDESSGKPTLDDPYDVYTRTLTVHIKPEKVALLGPDGQVVWSCVPGHFRPAASPTLLSDPETLIWSSDYPYSAYRERRSGTVAMLLRINSDGAVSDCSIGSTSGSSELDGAACRAVKQRAKFTPAADQDGNPVPADFTLRLTYKSPY